jgi:hypothetical protein
MATSRRTYAIFPSSAVVASTTLTLLGSGSAGTLGAKRILTHPDAINFLPIVYFTHPQFTLGIDNEVLPRVQGSLVRTAETTKVVRHPEFESDVVIVEKWPSDSGISMPSFMARQLYEYAKNTPALNIASPNYITWQPRDKNDKTYNVVIVSFNIGGDEIGIDFTERRGAENNEILGDMEGLDVSPTGAIQGDAELVMKIVSEAA